MAISVSYEELGPESPREDWDQEERSGRFLYTRRLLCAWADRHTLANEITTYPDNIYPYLTLGGQLGIYALGTTIEPHPGRSLDAGGGLIAYDKAVVTVRYKLSYREGGVFLTEDFNMGIKQVRLDHRAFVHNSNGTDPLKSNEAPTVFVPYGAYSLTIYKAALIPTSILSLPGYSNSNPIGTFILGLTFAADTLLYAGGRIERSLKPGGLTSFTVRQTCLFNPFTWSKFPNSSTGLMESIYLHDGTPFSFLGRTNMNLLQ